MRISTRRTFVKFSSGGLGLAVTGTSVLGANDRINVGLIGCAGMGHGDLKEFLKLPNVHCVALCDVDDRRSRSSLEGLQKQFSIGAPLITRDFRQVLDRKDIDAVIVATPDNWHALITVMACQAGKDVYVEKPLSPTLAEDAAMVRAARKYDRVVQAGTQHRSAEHLREAVEYLKSGQLGRIACVRVFCYLDWMQALPPAADTAAPSSVDYDMWLGPAPKRPFNPNRFHFNWRWHWDYASGLLGDWGVHLMDIALWGMGGQPPLAAASAGGKFAFPEDGRETPDTQQVLYTFPGHTMLWEHSMGRGIGPYDRDAGVSFHGSEGMMIATPGGWRVLPETEGEMIRTPGKLKRYRMAGVPSQGAVGDSRTAHVRNFVDCMRSRKRPAADIETCRNTCFLLHMGNIAQRTGKQVRLDPGTLELQGDAEVRQLASRRYRTPWELPRI